MPDDISRTMVEQYGLAGFLLICFVFVIGYLGKYFISQMEKKDIALTQQMEKKDLALAEYMEKKDIALAEYMKSVDAIRMAAEARYQTSIEKVTDKFEAAIKSLSTETKDTFGHLTDAIDKLREEMHRSKS